MVHDSLHEDAGMPESGAEVGAVLDAQYRLLEKQQPVSGRPCFMAEDVRTAERVELIVTNETRGRMRYIVRRRFQRTAPAAPAAPAAQHPLTNQRALEAFQSRVALTGVCIRKQEQLVFHGWDRETQRAVRVVIEPWD